MPALYYFASMFYLNVLKSFANDNSYNARMIFK